MWAMNLKSSAKTAIFCTKIDKHTLDRIAICTNSMLLPTDVQHEFISEKADNAVLTKAYCNCSMLS
jgi:hypothetical protein